jgi:Transient receptor potential (TRP) ion channel/ML-like domain
VLANPSFFKDLAYTVPDLDGTVQIFINNTNGESVACVEAQLSNGKTVDQKAVGWITAVIAGLGLIASALSSGLGHSNTAAHVAANALSLFGYFQAQAMIGMTSVKLPPIVQSWTMNFNWSMGIIKVHFMQRLFTWFQQSTGGTPSTVLSELSTTSVVVQKRSVEVVHKLLMRAYYQSITPRSNANSAVNEVNKVVIVQGIKRVAFKSGIEYTNLFMTGLSFLIIFFIMVALGVAAFKGFCEAAVKFRLMKSEKFLDFRENWKTVLKGIMYRLVSILVPGHLQRHFADRFQKVIIGYPQMAVLCLWELTVIDSPAEVVLALFFFLSMTGILSWACYKVYLIAKSSMHKNPAITLFSDNETVNRWGFLYVQFKASAYYFIGPLLIYILLKAMFISFGQKSGTLQAIALVLIELVALVAVSYYRPWMDKRTNLFNISICSINFLNVIFLLVFSNVFNQPVCTYPSYARSVESRTSTNCL